MSLINSGLIFIAGLNAGLALLIWLRNPKNKINISFGLSILFLASWSLGMAIFRESTDPFSAWLWTWVQNISGSLVVIPFFLFSIYFPYQSKTLKFWHFILIGISLAGAIFVAIVPGVWIKSIILMPPNNDYILNRIGVGYFNIYFYFYLFFAFYIFTKKYLSSQGFLKTQLFYLMLATGIMSFFGSIFAALIPLILGRLGPYFWISPYFSVIMIIFLAYFVYRK